MGDDEKKKEMSKSLNKDDKEEGQEINDNKKEGTSKNEESITKRKRKSSSEVKSSPARKALRSQENSIGKLPSKKNEESPHLSSTISCDKSGKKKVKVPKEISPIPKKTKSISSKADKSVGGYFDQIMSSKKIAS